jgi:predicted nuclease of predicted toxin-antitoxin system
VKFKLDEKLPVSSARLLAKSGHDVDTVAAEGLTGAADRDVVAAAAEERVLITLDRGLGDLRAYPPGSHAGNRSKMAGSLALPCATNFSGG